jgi:hypothetical protein
LSEKSGQDDSNESDSDEATTEVISHTEGLEALERALLCVEQHSKATPTDVMFMKALAGHCSLFSSFNTLSEENIRFCKKRTIYKCVSYRILSVFI